MRFLTLGSCLKQEEAYILDFIKYHRYIGVQHFIFLDREYFKLKELLKNEPDVEILFFPETVANNHQEAWGQLIAYNQNKTKYLALIDADQALVPVKSDNICEILSDYDFASIQLNWKTFGSSYKLKKESGSVYERFLLCCSKDSQYSLPTQFICQPDRVLPIKTEEPHYPQLPKGELSINTNKQIIDSNKKIPMNPARPLIFNSPPLFDVMWVAHYSNKSKEEWLFKNAKGRADIIGTKIHTTQFDEYDKECNMEREERVLQLWLKANKV
jgi:glycosyl transferase family 2